MTPREHATALVEQAQKTGASDPQMYCRLLISATSIDPTYALAWFYLGDAMADTGALDAACVCFRRAIAADPTDVRFWVNLSYRTYWAGNPDECLKAANVALYYDPLNAYAHINGSLAHTIYNECSKAIADAHVAIMCDDSSESRQALAFALLASGDYARGLAEHEARFEKALKFTQHFPWPRWKGEDITGKTLMIYADQGIGDTISFMRFVKEAALRADKTCLVVNNELLRVVSELFVKSAHISVQGLSQPLPACDVWTAFMSLPFALGMTNTEIQIAAEPKWPAHRLSAHFRVPGADLHVGVCWSGNPECAIEKFRRVPLDHFKTFANIPGVALYSLQVGPAAQELYDKGFSTFITDLAPLVRDVADTFSILRELDLVITSDTSVHHMCGALGVPCWLLVSLQGVDFRIGRDPEKTGILWYPNHRAFMQDFSADWRPVIARVKDELSALVAARVSDASL